MDSKEPNVIILGTGPSAAYAYRACADVGIIPRVMSNTDPSRTRGAFWLNWLPSTVSKSVQQWSILVSGIGSAQYYMHKQWQGQYDNYASSFPKAFKNVLIYDPVDGLDALWGKDVKIEKCGWLSDMYIREIAAETDVVIQTFPTQASKKVKPEPGRVWVGSTKCEAEAFQTYSGICIYNGHAGSSWLRCTAAFGEQNFEYACREDISKHVTLNTETGIHWYPNLQPDCTPYIDPVAENVILTGRFARWDRRELAHDSYKRVQVYLLQRFGAIIEQEVK